MLFQINNNLSHWTKSIGTDLKQQAHCMMVYQRNGAHSIFAIELIEYHLQVLIHVLCVSGNFEEFFFLYRSVVDD